jgi:hypothetical protein
MRLGKPGSIERGIVLPRRPAQDEPVVQKPAARVADRDRALEQGESPRFAGRYPSGGKGVDEDEPGGLVELDIDGLTQRRARERDGVVGHPLDDRARADRRAARSERSAQPSARYTGWPMAS